MTADDLVAQLDARGEPWDLHRGVGDGSGPIWVVALGKSIDTGGSGLSVRRFHASTLVDVLAQAVDAGPPLPVVPRRPFDNPRHMFEARRDGSKWALYYDGQSAGYGNQPTKRACEEAADRWATAQQKRIDEWHAKFSETITSGVEGVDFRWAT